MRRQGPAGREITYLVEQYVPGRPAAELRRLVDRVRQATTQGAGQGEIVRFVQATIVPHDACVLSLVTAPSESTVRSVLAGAGLDVDRISVAIVDDRRSPTSHP